jgi:hypothetical protein
MSMRVCQWVTISRVAIKSVASSALAAKAMMNLIMVAIVRTAPLKGGVGYLSRGRYVHLLCFGIKFC